jgi:F-type H+-transporting ATPase subunit c
MKKLAFLVTALAVMTTAGVALADDTIVVAAAGLETIGTIALGAALAISLGTLGPAIAQGLTCFSALSGIARNPEATGAIRTNMIIGLALIESLTIYALVVALILIFAFPYSSIVSAVF